MMCKQKNDKHKTLTLFIAHMKKLATKTLTLLHVELHH